MSVHDVSAAVESEKCVSLRRSDGEPMTTVVETVATKGDLAHLALFLWASGASSLLLLTLRELHAANRRFDAFVRELARFNTKVGVNPP
jgi:hypothetical protein